MNWGYSGQLLPGDPSTAPDVGVLSSGKGSILSDDLVVRSSGGLSGETVRLRLYSFIVSKIEGIGGDFGRWFDRFSLSSGPV